MRFLPRPDQVPLDTYALCISRVQDQDLKQRLEGIADRIRDAAVEYENRGNERRFYLIGTHTQVEDVTSKELEGVYTSRMVGKLSPGRRTYERLRSSSPQNLCPFCAQRTVGTLDHYLPKSEYPSLVVVPHNLVPSCRDCNSAKRSYIATSEAEQLLHPYFDNFAVDQWLFAEVHEGPPAVLSYSVRQTGQITDTEFMRLQKNFSVLDLAELYASHAAAELANINFQLQMVFEAGGAEGVRDHLAQAFLSRSRIHVNSWQSACYQAVSQNDWFCSGGFREVE